MGSIVSKSISKIILSLVVLNLFACNSSSGNKDNGTVTGQQGGAGSYLGSYEANDGCTTGRNIFSGSTAEEIGTAFCNGLKDEERNQHCAQAQRADIFKTVQCPGTFPINNTSGVSSVFTENYSIQENGCSTGVQFFSASTEKALNLMYCKGLSDEKLNRDCAKDKRTEKYQENNCDEVLKNAPQDKVIPTVETAKPAEEKSGVESEKFTCYSEARTCNSSSQYCLISKTIEGGRLTDECIDLPKNCSDESCVAEDAKKHFGNHNNCDSGLQIERKNSKITVNCMAGI